MSLRFSDVSAFEMTEDAAGLLSDVLEATTGQSLIATDLQGRIVLWSEGARQLHGFTAAEMLGQEIERLRPHVDTPGMSPTAMLEAALAEGRWEGKAELARQDGPPFQAHVVMTLRLDRIGEPVGFLTMASDVTEQVGLVADLSRARASALAILESAADAIVIVDGTGEIQRANAATEALFGYPRAELIGRHAEVLIPAYRLDLRPDHAVQLFSGPSAAKLAGVGLELTGRRKDGVELPVHLVLSPLSVEEGLVIATIRAAAEDHGQDRRDEDGDGQPGAMEGQAIESAALLETLLLTAPIGFGFVDRDLRMRRMNETLAAAGGGSVAGCLGRTVREIWPDEWPATEAAYRHVLDTGEAVVNHEWQVGERPMSKNGSRWLTSYYPVRLGDEVVGVGLTAVDITVRHEAEEFRAVVMRNMTEGLIVADAAGQVTFVNAAASTMLGWFEYELRGKSLHEMVHYQHADGTTFPEADCQMFSVQTNGRTLRMVNDAFTRKDGTIFPVSYSAGPLYSGDAVRGFIVAFRDTAEYQTDRDRAQRELDALLWVGRIRDAIDEDRLTMHSQSIVSLSSHAAATEELLVRMIGRDGELILPGSFLPAAEKYGQIGEIDEWAITQAIALAARGRRVHVNLSAGSISSLDLFHRIESALRDAGADPANVVFEITETAVMEDLRAGEAFARAIEEIGCTLALDDFGTGYGSFTYLQRLRISYLKIDIAFVHDLVSNTANQHLVKAIVNIAQGLGQQTIAEGVEDRATLDLLRAYGVDMAQGYFCGLPQPIDCS